MSQNRRLEMLLRHAHEAECANVPEMAVRIAATYISIRTAALMALMASRLRSLILFFQFRNTVYVDSRHFSSWLKYRARKCHARHRHQARNVSATLRLSVLSISHSLVDEDHERPSLESKLSGKVKVYHLKLLDVSQRRNVSCIF